MGTKKFNPNPGVKNRLRPGLQVPTLPDTPGSTELMQFLGTLAEYIEQGEGYRGQPNQRYVTVQDLKDVGLSDFVVKNRRAELGQNAEEAKGSTADAAATLATAAQSFASLTDTVINSPTNLQVPTYLAATKKWENRDPLAEATVLCFNLSPIPPTLVEGCTFYDSTKHAFSYQNAIVNVATGQETVVRIFNNSGATIAKGLAVYIDGEINNVPTVSKARANAVGTSKVVGITMHELTFADGAGDFGYVMVNGGLVDFDTSAFTNNDQVYLSPSSAGALTATRPTDSTHFTVPLGIITEKTVGETAIGHMQVRVQQDIESRNSTLYNGTTLRVIADASGITVTGDVSINDASSVLFGSDDDAGIQHDGSDWTFEESTGAIIINNTGRDIGLNSSTVTIVAALTATSYGGITETNLLDKTATETVSGAYTFTAIPTISMATPRFLFNETDGSADEGNYDMAIQGSVLRYRTRTDVDGAGVTYMEVYRTGAAVTSIDITSPAIELVGAVTVTGAVLATSYGGITEANLVDKSATETIAGAWTFTADPTISGSTEANLYLLDATATADEGLVRISSRADQFQMQTREDDDADGVTFFRVTRTGTSIDVLSLLVGAGANALVATTAADVVLYANNIASFKASTGGQIHLLSATSTDTENRLINFLHQDLTSRGFVGYAGSDVLQVSNTIHGGNVVLNGEDAGGTVRQFLLGDPDALSTLTGDTGLNLVATGGVIDLQSAVLVSGGTGSIPMLLLESAIPFWHINDSNAATDEGLWEFNAAGANLSYYTGNDAYTVLVKWMEVARTGTVVDNITFTASDFTLTLADDFIVNTVDDVIFTPGSAGMIFSLNRGAHLADFAVMKVVTEASATARAGLQIQHGTAPTSPSNGDIWTTTSGLFVRINGSTVGPLTA